MDINFLDNTFRDVAIGITEFNEFNNKEGKWQEPKGDKLIMGVIDQVCTFAK